MRMQLVEPFICGLLRMKMERRLPTKPSSPTTLSRIPGRKKAKKKLCSSAGKPNEYPVYCTHLCTFCVRLGKKPAPLSPSIPRSAE